MSSVPSDRAITQAESGSAQSVLVDAAQESEPAVPAQHASRSHHNEALPIHRLANEILSSIFCFVWCEDYAQDVRNRLNLSSVCHHWREVALGCPRLWTRIEPLRQPLFDVILGRSKEAPLDIEYVRRYYGALGMPFGEFIGLVLPRAHRWRTCHLRYPVSNDELVSFFFEPMPLLEALTIGHNFGWESYAMEKLTPPLAPGYAPRLGALALERVFIPFTHPFYSNLTELALSYITFRTLDSMLGLLHALEASPLLKRLHLEQLGYVSHITPKPIYSSTSLVQLHHLQVLHIEAIDPEWMARRILASLAIPPCALIKLLYFGENMSTFLPLRDHIQVHLPALSSAFALHVSFFRDTDVEGYTFEHEELFKFHLHTVPELPVMFAELGTILPTPFLQSFSLYYMGSGDPAAATAVADFLTRHPLITHLVFRGCHESMIRTLLDASICPRLDSLRIEKCCLSPESLVKIMEVRTRPKGSESKVCRVDSVHGLGRLEVSGCPQFEPILPSLRLWGGDVVVEH
ncbi:hypothetical protein BOTBODRAFT_35369, partial [Botryobasidium botryosum FD-172 SS1]